jgi:copper ion binding protein
MKATLSIVGMTCGTCVGKISEALEAKPWSRSVDVNLLNNSAVVTVEDERHLVDLIQAIEDIGYEPTLERVDRMKSSQESTSETSQASFRASYAVGGMTCSTCIENITEALQKYDWIKRTDINLISNSATIMFVGKDHLEQIADAIEDVGYE